MDKYFKLIKKFFETSCSEIKRTEETLNNLFKHLPSNQIALSLNGGKDSTVVLFLALYFVNLYKPLGQSSYKLKCVYMKEKSPFKEILVYLDALKSTFDIEVYEYDNDNIVTTDFMKHALTEFINTHNIKAVISGTRSTDPYCQNLELIVKTDIDKGWPDILRVMPIYMWTYEQIWSFIIQNQLPYCSLYNIGYTYVGDKANSLSNPFLYDQPAWQGNDNIELFSRTSLYNKLTRKDNKLYFNHCNILFIVTSADGRYIELSGDEVKVINDAVKRFEDGQGYLIDNSEVTPIFEDERLSAVSIKTKKIIELKRKPGNYDKLYLSIVYSSSFKEVLYIGL